MYYETVAVRLLITVDGCTAAMLGVRTIKFPCLGNKTLFYCKRFILFLAPIWRGDVSVG